MRTGSHSHLCYRCMAKVDCGGDLEPNHDGWPEVVCPVYHGMDRSDWLCETCAEAAAAAHAAELLENV